AIMTQVNNWRSASSGVDWNEELTNMIKYQKAFVACSRCLNAMDECLDRLVNSTGSVGR
ncbi:MAG: flagellar hook-associated protein FlgK, partial [Selenomonadaceae bacterium]|nr:flagellar hook-associated protein FlgK [Selenomonadaceae bacterium]